MDQEKAAEVAAIYREYAVRADPRCPACQDRGVPVMVQEDGAVFSLPCLYCGH